MQRKETILTESVPDCYLCGSKGEFLYRGLKDALFDAPGEWNFKKCPKVGCGLVWLDPRPVKDDLGKVYANYYTHKSDVNSFAYKMRQRVKRGYAGLAFGYAKVPIIDQIMAIPIMFLPFVKQYIICSGLMCLRGDKTGSLLEIGSGRGLFLSTMRDLGWDTEGIDIDNVAVETAKKNYGLNIHCGELKEQSYPDGAFDAVVMSHVIEHMHDPSDIIAECWRVLRPGGKIVILTPNIDSLGHRKFKNCWLYLDPPRHIHLFSIQTIRQIFEKNRFTIDMLCSNTRWADGLWSSSYRLKNYGKTKIDSEKNVIIKTRSKIFQIIEALLLMRNKTMGEDILLIGRKIAQ